MKNADVGTVWTWP